jgi:subtilisin family serine protease
MNKKIITALIALTLIVPATSNAANLSNKTLTPTVAILDTALDSSLPIFNGRIAKEVCILEWNSCPNGKSFMEGPGSAGLPSSIIAKNGFNHGTQMSSIFIANSPNVNIVFVRIIGNTPSGERQLANEITVVNALDWVYKNKDVLNIQAVTMAMGHHNLGHGTSYCPNTPATQLRLKNFVSIGLPVFIAAGNAGDLKRIDWPSCIDDSISVGAATAQDELAIYSNYDENKIDFIALGNTVASQPVTGKQIGVRGTSASTQIAAANWLAVKNIRPGISYQDLYALMRNSAIPAKSTSTIIAKLISYDSAVKFLNAEEARKSAEEAAKAAALAAAKAAAIESLMKKQEQEIMQILERYNASVLELTKAKDSSITALKATIAAEVLKLG